MRRILATLALIVGLAAILSSGVAAGGNDGGYEVRALFDNGGFLVKGEEVRVAGANVGTIEDVSVSDNDEPVHRDGRPDPGKAVVVMRIEDPAFQDFRSDASCLIRPQSLLGERFVECSPTQPRAPGSTAPPELSKVPDGDPGAGQRFLPIESNGKAVDLDLVNNIQRLPYAERFRIILNDLGAALAGRGKDLSAVIRRADPALRVTDQVLAKLARQNKALERLARDGDAVLTPLQRDRQHITGFLANANAAAEATAERKPALEAQFERLPRFLRELRLTMVKLKSFSDQAQPTFADLGAAAPAATRATKALGPFSRAGIPAFASLGNAAAQTQGPLNAADPVIRQLRDLTRSGRPGSRNLNKLLASTRRTNGFKYIDQLFFNGAGAVNGFDNFGHILRAILPPNNCVLYQATPLIGCASRFGAQGAASGRLTGAQVAAMFRKNGLSYLRKQQNANAKSFKAAKGAGKGADPIKAASGLLDFIYGPDHGSSGGSDSSGTTGTGGPTGATGATGSTGTTGASDPALQEVGK